MKLVRTTDELPETYVIKFYADWCGPCKSFEPVYEKAEEILPTVEFLTCDVDDAEVNILAKFNVRSIPSVFYVDGDNVKRLTATPSPREFTEQLRT